VKCGFNLALSSHTQESCGYASDNDGQDKQAAFSFLASHDPALGALNSRTLDLRFPNLRAFGLRQSVGQDRTQHKPELAPENKTERQGRGNVHAYLERNVFEIDAQELFKQYKMTRATYGQ
jgi:hypothetical protein